MFSTLPHELIESYPAVVDSVPRARLAVTELASRYQITGELLDGVRLAVTEAVTNSVRHAYPNGPGAVHLMATVAGDELWILVADDGCGYQTPSAQPGMGWGLMLIARHSDEYVITERAAGGTEVRMRFPLRPARQSADT